MVREIAEKVTGPRIKTGLLAGMAGRFAPYGPFFLRLMAGIVFFAHGYSKLQHPAGFIGLLTNIHMPFAFYLGWFVMLLETVGSVALILGLAVRYLGLFYIVEMATTTWLVKRNLGLVAPPRSPAPGYELDLLLLFIALALVLLGPGALSIERNLLRREL